MPTWIGLGFQDSRCFLIRELVYLHDHIIVIMSIVLIVVFYLFFLIFFFSSYYKFLSEGTIIEVVWSVIPAFLLILLVFPSVKVLYLMEDIKSPVFRVKVVAHQWYWTYIVPFYMNLGLRLDGGLRFGYEYDSIMENIDSREDFVNPRLLGCRNELYFSEGVVTRLLIRSADVIHCFALPRLGLKVDALPGRINQLFVNPRRLGVFYGECSEICGSNHSFIPILVKVCEYEDYLSVRKLNMMEMIIEYNDSLVCCEF